MSGFLPPDARGLEPERPHPSQIDRRRTVEDVRRSWEVRAAQWQARALAEAVFDGPVTCTLTGMRAGQPWRGLLRLDVPFDDLESHRTLEARFLASAGRDPLLSRVPFVYVIGPDES